MEIKRTEAAILVETGKPLVIDTIELPDQLLSGQVLVKLITSGICGAQINEIDAVKGPDKFLPHLLGHEGLAEVIEVGPAVKKVKLGDTVVLHWRPSAGIQSETPKYMLGNKVVNAGWVTTFNRHAVISENRLTKINNFEDPLFMPLLGCALTTALGVLDNDAKLTHRDSLLITGFGGVGIALLQFAKFMNAQNIIIVDKDENKRKFALEMGADFYVNWQDKSKTSHELAKIYSLIGRPDVAIDTTGIPSVIEVCYEISNEHGRIVLVGVPKAGNNTSIYTLPLHFGKSITGSKGGGAVPDLDIPYILKLISEKKIKVDNFPVVKKDLSQINEGIQELRRGILGRVVVDFS